MTQKKILIVEDNELNMKLFRDLLEANDFQVVATGDGKTAIEMTKLHTPSLIVMDIQLPDISGLELIRLIKQDGNIADIPIVAVTAFAMKGDEETIRASGCDAYVSKPISVGNFLNTVKGLLNNEIE